MFSEELVKHVESTTNASYFVNEAGQWRGSAAKGFEEVSREEILGKKSAKKADAKAKGKGKGSEKEISEEEKLQAEIEAEEKAKADAAK